MRKVAASIWVTAWLVVGCAAAEDEPAATDQDTTAEDTTAQDTPAPEPDVSAAAPESRDAEVVMRNQVTIIDPPDEAGFLDALRLREPARMTEFDDAELVELGVVACNAAQGYIPGSSPNPGDELVSEMTRRGHPPELAEKIAPDIRNAIEDTICKIERIPE